MFVLFFLFRYVYSNEKIRFGLEVDIFNSMLYVYREKYFSFVEEEIVNLLLKMVVVFFNGYWWSFSLKIKF